MNLMTQKKVFESAKKAVEEQIDYLQNSHWRKRIFGDKWYQKNIQSIENIQYALDSAIVAIENLEKDQNDQIAWDNFTKQLETINKIHVTPTIQTNSRWKKVRTWLEKDHSVRKKIIELSLGATLLTITVLTIPFTAAWLGFCIAALLAVPFAAKEIKKAKMLTKKHLKKSTEDIQRAGSQVQVIVSNYKFYLQNQELTQNINEIKQEITPLISDQCSLIRSEEYSKETKTPSPMALELLRKQYRARNLDLQPAWQNVGRDALTP